MTQLLLKLLLSYLLGSVSGSLLLGRWRGVDIRTRGSGNAGATNALRTLGWKFALSVLLIDVGKGIVAALLIGGWQRSADPAFMLDAVPLACGLAAAIGHCFPVWHGFRGGKGAGTLFGSYLLLHPWAALIALLGWFLCLGSTGYVGLSTMVAASLLLPAVWWLGASMPTLELTVLALVLVLWMHRSNLAKMRAGTENRFDKARILRR